TDVFGDSFPGSRRRAAFGTARVGGASAGGLSVLEGSKSERSSQRMLATKKIAKKAIQTRCRLHESARRRELPFSARRASPRDIESVRSDFVSIRNKESTAFSCCAKKCPHWLTRLGETRRTPSGHPGRHECDGSSLDTGTRCQTHLLGETVGSQARW